MKKKIIKMENEISENEQAKMEKKVKKLKKKKKKKRSMEKVVSFSLRSRLERWGRGDLWRKYDLKRQLQRQTRYIPCQKK